ncbi:MAG: fatty acid desaturase [Mycobacterium sp.]
MSTVDVTIGRTQPGTIERRGLPDPGESVPKLAWPTLAVLVGALLVFGISSLAAIGGHAPIWVTILANAAAIFAMFTVIHDAVHHAVSTTRWVNGLVGRLPAFFVIPLISLPSFAFIHIEHHRNANDDDNDPDSFASHAPMWQLPFRWALIEVFYGAFLVRRLRSRPKAEVAETAALVTLSVALLTVAIVTGNFWTLAVVYLIPQRIGLIFLAWWFDWLPHHGLEETQRSNPYRATRTRVGMEWLFTPLLLSQNYHLVHHLHPSIPFYKYLTTWRRNEAAYLERGVAIATVFGQQLNPDQFREWKQLNSKLGRVLPLWRPSGSSAPHPMLHRLPVAAVEKLTSDSTLVTFTVPEDLRDQFRFEAGQHVAVQSTHDGHSIRRTYSICTPATQDTLQIAVKHIPGGSFSTFVADDLKPGDVLDLMTPTGSLGTPIHPLQQKHYVGLVAGSGITPVLSILATVLEVETQSRFTLIYGNRTQESTMFRTELDRLQTRYADRLKIEHVLSDDPRHTPELCGHIDADKLDRWLTTDLAPETTDEWFLCGPMGMTTTAWETLIGHGVRPEQLHLELFFGYAQPMQAARDYEPATVTARLGGQESTFDLAPGESILEGALQVRSETPYACMGGACGACRAKLVRGTVEMDQNFTLGKADLDAGYILTCQSHPTSPSVEVDYDAKTSE